MLGLIRESLYISATDRLNRQLDQLTAQIENVRNSAGHAAVQHRQQLRVAEDRAHSAELRAIRAETLAEVRALEIERLERLLIAVPGAPSVGGFLPFETAEADASEQPIADTFMSRLSEVTNGLSLEEAESRWADHRQQQVAALQAEQADVRAELKTLQELNES